MSNQQVILFTGKPGIGKTTIIRKILESLPDCGGFYTREVRINGKRVAFEIVTLDEEVGTLATSSPTPIFENQAMVGQYRVDIDVVDNLAVRALERAVENNKVIVIDEIGPMELFSQQFQDVVLSIINNSTLKAVGTIVERSIEFTDQLKQHPRVTVVHIDENNRDTICDELADRLKIFK